MIAHIRQQLSQPKMHAQNRCFKGDKCIYSHDIEHIRHVNTPQDGSCMSFVFGVCELPLCRFKHDVDMVKNLLLVRTRPFTLSCWQKISGLLASSAIH